jgi:hypothetical protein
LLKQNRRMNEQRSDSVDEQQVSFDRNAVRIRSFFAILLTAVLH